MRQSIALTTRWNFSDALFGAGIYLDRRATPGGDGTTLLFDNVARLT